MRPPRVFQAHLASRPARLSSLRMSNVRCRRTTGSKRYSRFQTLRSLNSIALSARRDRPISSLARTSADQSREVLAQFRIRSCGPRSVPLESARAVTLYAGFVRCWIRQMFGLASSSAKRPEPGRACRSLGRCRDACSQRTRQPWDGVFGDDRSEGSVVQAGPAISVSTQCFSPTGAYLR